MPGIFQLSINHAVSEAKKAYNLGIPGVLLFGVPDEKDEAASGAYDPEGIVQLATRAIKDAVPELLVVADVCLCEYTSHGHCGVVDGTSGEVLNDVSLELLARTAASQAEAGADIVAPSDMMDGRVAAIRSELDREGFENTPIMAYAAKYASAFYGPFREAAESTPQFGDRPQLPDGPGKRPRGAPGGKPGHRRGCGYRHRKTCVAVPRRCSKGSRSLRTCRLRPTT